MIWIFISSDKYEVRMDIKSVDPLWTNQTVETSKLICTILYYFVFRTVFILLKLIWYDGLQLGLSHYLFVALLHIM